MSTESKYTAAVIGCGDIGFGFDNARQHTKNGALTHFTALNSSDRFRIVSVADKNREVLNLIEDKYSIPVYEDYKEMMKGQRPDLVTVATDDETHFSILSDLLSFDPKFVFCEKPLALNSDDITAITENYKKAGIHLQVNYTRRFLEEFRKIKEELKKESIGRIETVMFYYSRGLIHNASHYIDLALWYFGNPDEVISFASKKGLGEADSSYSFILKYNEGPEIIFAALDIDKLSFAEIDIVGTKGRIKFNYRNEIEKYSVKKNPVFAGYSQYELIETAPVKFESAIPNAYENAYGVLSGKNKLLSPSENSSGIFKIVNRILQ
ncbi:MAG: Gfo/Idh/MocA family oxidoreductase [Bacteroidetes bacterium]|nr:Gfo/Idh/MocA family oxidoreductase [Bacteroidota bacterium]